jgi:hypothetical protein
MKKNYKRRSGFAMLAMVILIAAAFALMTMSTTDSVTLGLQHAAKTSTERRTSYGAYGAVQLAIDELSTNPNYACDVNNVTVAADPEMVYCLRIVNNYTGALSPNPTTDGIKVPTGMAYIEARCDLRDYIGKYTNKVFSKAYLGNYESNYCVVGTDQVTIVNSTIDAYFVRGSGTYTLRPSGANRIATNSVQAGGLSLAGPNTKIDASLYWGPSGPATVVSNPGPPAVTVNTTSPRVQGQLTGPVRVPRYRPPRDPSDALAPTGVVSNIITSTTLGPANYKAVNVTGATLTLQAGEYFIAKNLDLTNCNVELSGVSAGAPCDLYVGGNVTINNSNVNWANRLGSSDPAVYPTMMTGRPGDVPLVLDSAALGAQAVLGPRTMRIFFVGSGAPRFKDGTFIANNSRVCLHAAGKAMKVELSNGTEMWGGFKGSRFSCVNSTLHYHKGNK